VAELENIPVDNAAPPKLAPRSWPRIRGERHPRPWLGFAFHQVRFRRQWVMTSDASESVPPKCLQDDVRRQFEANGRADMVASLEEAYAGVIGRRRDFVAYGDPATVPERDRAFSNIEVIRQVQLHRAERLMASAGAMITERNVYGLVLLIRGHYESTAILGYLCDRVDSFAKDNVPFGTVILNIAHAMMGGRHERFAKMPDPINILTAIEKADRYFERRDKSLKKGMLADCYGWLSETAHPNFNSSDAALRLNTERAGFEFRHGEALSDEEAELLGYLDISAELFLLFFDELGTLAATAFGRSEPTPA
jgi:hypothetical protein